MEDLQLQLFTLLVAIFVIVVGYLKTWRRQIAAVQEKKKNHQAGKKSGASPPATGSKQASSNLTHSEQARDGSGLCFSHWTFGAKATKAGK
jgi:hypothetical protein